MQEENIVKMGLTLALICLIAAAALAVSYQLTEPKIRARARDDRIAALRDDLPAAVSFSKLIPGEKIDYYRGLDAQGEVVGYAFSGEAKGYSSTISVMVGIDLKGTITGIKIIDQKETPGLGTRAVEVPATRNFWQVLFGLEGQAPPGRPPFQEQFRGKTVSELRVVTGGGGEGIEALTGATITSQAVTTAVKESLEAFLAQEKKK